jgi:hypothetical protein
MPAGLGPQETSDPVEADRRNFYKVEQWTRNGLHIERLLWAGNSIDTAREKFDAAVKRRPAGKYTIRQLALVLAHN